MSPRRKQSESESVQSESESAKSESKLDRTTAKGVVNIVKGTALLAHFDIKDVKGDRSLIKLINSFARMLRDMGTDVPDVKSLTQEPPHVDMTQDVKLYYSVPASKKLQCEYCGVVREYEGNSVKMDWCPVCNGTYDDDIDITLDI